MGGKSDFGAEFVGPVDGVVELGGVVSCCI